MSHVVTFTKLWEGVSGPTKAHDRDWGWDLYADTSIPANRERKKQLIIPMGGTRAISTGLQLHAQPAATKPVLMMIVSRSGLAARGIFVTNSPGIIDPDYTGELKVLLCNLSMQPYAVSHGDRIGQAIFIPGVLMARDVQWKESKAAPTKTDRGDGGLGSTGQ